MFSFSANVQIFSKDCVGSGNYIYFWKSKALSDERLNSNTASNYSITPELSFCGTKTRVEFNRSCLKQDEATHDPRGIVNIYIVCEINKNYNISSYPKLENYLFGSVSLTKNADIDQCKYSGYGIGFHRKGEFSFGSREFDRNCIIFGADNFLLKSSNNSKNSILVLGKNFTQGLNKTKIYAEKLYLINFTEKVLGCSYTIMEIIAIYLLMVVKLLKLKQKILKLYHIFYV